MPGNSKYNGLSAAIAMAALFTATSASAFSVSTGGTAVLNEGLVSSVSGVVTTDFNSGLLSPDYIGGGIKLGSVVGQWAELPGDTSHYLAVDQFDPAVISLGALASYFGYYGGSPDTYNSVQFWHGSDLIEIYTGTQLASFAHVAPDGNWDTGAYWNFTATNSSEWFDTVKMISTSPAFETDNHAVLFAVPEPKTFAISSPVPEPQTYAMLLAGLGLMGFMAYRRSKTS